MRYELLRPPAIYNAGVYEFPRWEAEHLAIPSYREYIGQDHGPPQLELLSTLA